MIDLKKLDLTKTADREMIVRFIAKLSEEMPQHYFQIALKAAKASSEPIMIDAYISEKICERLERSLYILESVDDSAMQQDLIEVAAAIFEAQQALYRLTHSRQATSPVSLSSSTDSPG